MSLKNGLLTVIYCNGIIKKIKIKNMENKEYSVTVWNRENGSGTSDQRWSGNNLDEALIVAAYEYAKEIILAELRDKKVKKRPTPWHRVDMKYAPKVKLHITVLEEIDSRLEAEGNLPKIIKSYGDKSIKIFQRVHFDR